MIAHNLAAEQIVLGAMMQAPNEILAVAEIVDAGDFYGIHIDIFTTICTAYTRHEDTGPVAILEALQRARVRVDGPYLHTIYAAPPVAANAQHYARIVRDLSLRRQMEAAGTTMIQRARDEPDEDISSLLADAEARIERIGKGITDTEFEFLNVQAFTETEVEFGEPVIPGLLHQQERVIIVAGEGVGKTELGLQAGMMTAVGLHPFVWEPQDPKRVMIMDLENPTANYQARLRRMLRTAEDTPGWDPDRCHVMSKPGGIDLRDTGTQRKLMARIDKVRPHLIVAGPLQKMSLAKGESGEELAVIAMQFWDRVRERHGSALWLEGHAPLGQGEKRDLRPMGSQRWMGWPEFGVNLRSSSDGMDQPGTVLTGTFRLNREDRTWPVKLVRARPWSWSGVYARPYLRP